MKHRFLQPLLFAVMILFVAEDLCFLLKTGAIAGMQEGIEVEGKVKKEEESKREKEEESKKETKEKDENRHAANSYLLVIYTPAAKNNLHGAIFLPSSAEIELETPPPEA